MSFSKGQTVTIKNQGTTRTGRIIKHYPDYGPDKWLVKITSGHDSGQEQVFSANQLS